MSDDDAKPDRTGRMLRMAAHAKLAVLIREMTMVRPESVLRTAVDGQWGVARLGLSETIAVYIPGVLAAIARDDPAALPDGTVVHADTLARLLADLMPLIRIAGSRVVALEEGGRTWSPCILVDGGETPWVTMHATAVPFAADDPTVTVAADTVRPRVSPMFASPFAGLIGTVRDLEDFTALIGDEPDAERIPVAKREAARDRWIEANLRMERARLRMHRQEIPSWLTAALGAGDGA